MYLVFVLEPNAHISINDLLKLLNLELMKFTWIIIRRHSFKPTFEVCGQTKSIHCRFRVESC